DWWEWPWMATYKYIISTLMLHEGESAEIICPYDSIYKSKPKSLCKGKCSTRDRNTLNETVREEKETKTGRLTLNDNVTARVFTGTITGLTAEDAGKYWCAVTLETDLNYLYTHLIQTSLFCYFHVPWFLIISISYKSFHINL
uniref:Immunoglobulin V-set domain-containing protein n=1 Tax=Sinocyclocheilus anshuiensis TaxID=1608454 RepID=A0A671NPF9_9TELE